MKSSKIGHSDLNVSSIGIGCMSLTGGPTKENLRIVQQAFDAGVNYFDTADMYENGLNEQMVGKAIHSFRKEVVLATKVGNQWRKDGSGWDWKASKTYILQEVDASLKRLDTDYIDLYQLHGGTIGDPIDEIIEAFEELVHAGKIRYYGLSSIRPNVFSQYASKSNICSNMMQYSILDRRPEAYFDALESAGVGVVARGALAQGLLIDKPVKEYLTYSSEHVGIAQKQVHQLASSLGLEPEVIALSYVLSHQAVTSAVVGVRNPDQLHELLHAKTSLVPLTSEQLDFLASPLPDMAYTEHLVNT